MTGYASKKIRLCIVMGSHWETRMGGAQYQVRCLLDQLKLQPEFESFYLTRLAPNNLERDHYTIVPFGSAKQIGRASFIPDLQPLYQALKSVAPDIIYQRGLKSYTAACALYSRRHQARFIFHAAHDDDVQHQKSTGWRPSRIMSRLERRLSEWGLRRADAIVVQTNDQRSMLKREYGLSAALTVRNFHPLPSSLPQRKDPELLRVTWIANFKPWKNPEIFVSLAEHFAGRPDIEFVMIGRSNEQYSALRERIARVPNLRYLGELQIEQVNDVLGESDLFVNTSKAEGFANTFIQAWLRRVPVISCYVDPDRCLSEGGSGILTGNAEGLVKAIDQLLQNRESLEQLKTAAHNYGIKNHSAEQAKPLISMLHELASQESSNTQTAARGAQISMGNGERK